MSMAVERRHKNSLPEVYTLKLLEYLFSAIAINYSANRRGGVVLPAWDEASADAASIVALPEKCIVPEGLPFISGVDIAAH